LQFQFATRFVFRAATVVTFDRVQAG